MDRIQDIPNHKHIGNLRRRLDELSAKGAAGGLDLADQMESHQIVDRIEELMYEAETAPEGRLQKGRLEMWQDPSKPNLKPPTGEFAMRAGDGWSVAVGADQSIADCTGGKRDNYVGFGEWLANELVGRPQTFASLQVSKDAGGGFATPQVLASSVIDAARAQQVCIRAGAPTIALPPAQSYSFAKISSDPTAVWRREAVHITASEPVFEQITMYPKTCAILIPVTRELMEDCLNMASVLETAVAGAIASALDYACIQGPGASSPTGVVNYPGIVSASNSNALWGWDDMIGMWQTPLTNHAPDYPTACLLSPAAEIHRRQLKDGSGDYQLLSDTPISPVSVLCSGNVPTTTLVMGDFTQMLIGVRTELRLEVLDAGTGSTASGDSFNATCQLGAWLRGYLRADMLLMRPEWFSILTDVSNA